ncbi:MAG: RrF2 family transcriptional regulator [Mycobacterium leprae]
MKLSTKGRYGVKALLDLAMQEGTGPVSLKSVAERQGLSEHYLEQLAAPLRKGGLIVSVRGAQGGYALSRPAREIAIADIVRVMEGPICFADSEGESSTDRATDLVLNGLWNRVTDQITRVMEAITLQDLADQVTAEQGKANFMYQI